MTRMLRRNLKTGLCDCTDCGNGDYRGRAAEEREWRKEQISDEADFDHLVRNLQVPGWCPVIAGGCPDWCGHRGVGC